MGTYAKEHGSMRTTSLHISYVVRCFGTSFIHTAISSQDDIFLFIGPRHDILRNFFNPSITYPYEFNGAWITMNRCCEFVDWQQTFCPRSSNTRFKPVSSFRWFLGWYRFQFCIQDGPCWKLQSSSWGWCNCSLVMVLFPAFLSRALSLDLL